MLNEKNGSEFTAKETQVGMHIPLNESMGQLNDLANEKLDTGLVSFMMLSHFHGVSTDADQLIHGFRAPG